VDIILLVLHVFLSLGIITLVLLQKGAGATAGAAFGGGGGAGSVFGATGSANFLSKTTAIFAMGFFVNSLLLAYLAANRGAPTDSVIDSLVGQPAIEEVVVVPGADEVPAPEGLVMPESAVPEAAAADEVIDDVPPPAGE